jgi:glycosyltransferase involved in cell wall biosynthesis
VSEGLFLSWAPFSRRTETLAEVFGLDLRFVSSPWPKRPLTAPLKYPVQSARTAGLLSRERPATLWVMGPPTPAVVLAWLHARRHRTPLVIDLHTVWFYAARWRLLRPLELPALRAARAAIVTNDALAARLRRWGAPAFVLPDPPPRPAVDPAWTVEPGAVTVVATFSPDEPMDVLPEVAARCPGLTFHVTGTPRGDLRSWPANLKPTGFLSDGDYWRRLATSQVVVVLTTRPDTLLSGGYEAMVLGRPLVTSDHAVLREYFGEAAVYAGDAAGGLAAAVTAAASREAELSVAIRELAARREAEWQRAATRLRALIGA